MQYFCCLRKSRCVFRSAYTVLNRAEDHQFGGPGPRDPRLIRGAGPRNLELIFTTVTEKTSRRIKVSIHKRFSNFLTTNPPPPAPPTFLNEGKLQIGWGLLLSPSPSVRLQFVRGTLVKSLCPRVLKIYTVCPRVLKIHTVNEYILKMCTKKSFRNNGAHGAH